MKYLTTADVAKDFDVDIRTVQRWIKNGRLVPSYRTPGGQIRFSQDYIRGLKCPDNTAKSHGSTPEAAYIMSSGTISPPVKPSASAFVREMLTKQRIATRRSSSRAPTSTPEINIFD